MSAPERGSGEEVENVKSLRRITTDDGRTTRHDNI